MSLKLLCEYKLGYFGHHWTLKSKNKSIFSGESSSENFMKIDAEYWATRELGHSDFEIKFSQNDYFKHRSD